MLVRESIRGPFLLIAEAHKFIGLKADRYWTLVQYGRSALLPTDNQTGLMRIADAENKPGARGFRPAAKESG
jgi:hypothetical protein